MPILRGCEPGLATPPAVMVAVMPVMPVAPVAMARIDPVVAVAAVAAVIVRTVAPAMAAPPMAMAIGTVVNFRDHAGRRLGRRRQRAGAKRRGGRGRRLARQGEPSP